MYAYCPKLKYIYISGIPGTWSGSVTDLPNRNNGTLNWIKGGVASTGVYYYPNKMSAFFIGYKDPIFWKISYRSYASRFKFTKWMDSNRCKSRKLILVSKI